MRNHIYHDKNGVLRDSDGREVYGFMTEAKALELMVPLVREGMTDRQVADSTGIAQRFVEKLKRKHAAKFQHA